MAELDRLYEDEATVAKDAGTPPDLSDEKVQEPSNKPDSSDAKEVLAELRDADYVNFVKILNSDGKTKAFLDFLRQHYKLGDDSIKTIKKSNVQEGTLKCSSLVPTQQNISLSKSLGMINKPGWSEKIINTPTEAFDTPTVTYAGKYIIDGHHRWSKAYALNGADCTIKVLNFPAIDGVTWEDMLKAVQLAIVATTPSASLENPVKDDNMLTASDETIRKFVIDNVCDAVVGAMKAKGRGDSKESVANTIVKNVAQMRETGLPAKGAKPRAYMPQMDDDGKAKDVLSKAVIDLTL
jgi:hypothetical protein